MKQLFVECVDDDADEHEKKVVSALSVSVYLSSLRDKKWQ